MNGLCKHSDMQSHTTQFWISACILLISDVHALDSTICVFSTSALTFRSFVNDDITVTRPT